MTFNEKELFKEIIKDSEYNINVILGIYMIHFASIISKCFSGTILISAIDKYWLTTDNPVVWDSNNDYSSLINFETEFYLPLNSKYCLYLYHLKSRSNLVGLKNQDFYQCEDTMHELVMNKIIENDFEYMVSPVNLGLGNLNLS